ncbi:hypothetical protein A3A38_02315 [Candidatus Kaiserbacteria bacterium RIFCSPLOWO2_01_FULL_53_17]|uniref:Uncharacterized protein n=1 Tax=Candidatus Kaiserbacteria bacterium RIFCSPLOWO2_01_FULL_53_17 TaxID=1798511 RepID=A0A1F6EHS1_9BACT|nr:MAG: hypothetical protein A3A38_02315 [Candidatus Kaiserbacteria bacterium RIFCSPLOWO2_01_FULL_53_17]
MATTHDKHLEYLIEQKILELYGDPDAGLELKESFVAELRRRTRKKQKTIPLSAVLKKYGLR